MAGVFVFSASGVAARQHFQRTIEQGVALEELAPLVNDGTLHSLRAAYPNGRAYLWAAQDSERNRHFWDQMEPGDLVLAYRERGLLCASYIVTTAVNAPLGQVLWPDEVQRPYDLIYFLTEPVFFPPVPVAAMPRYFGEIYQGLRRILGSEAILQDFGSYENFVRVALRGLPRALGQHEAAEAAELLERIADAGQGFEASAAVRDAIELHAMREARQHYVALGYTVEDVSANNPYDLRCTRGDERRFVEVKGSQGDGRLVLLTRNEVDFARLNRQNMALFVLHSVVVVEDVPGPSVTGGVQRVLDPWDVSEGELSVVNYAYDLPPLDAPGEAPDEH